MNQGQDRDHIAKRLEELSRRAVEAARKLADLLEASGDTAGALAVLKRATRD